jgi:phospholipid-binding lipoprotein MlaA
LLLTSGCATTGNPDPYEGFNRKISSFNDTADRLVLEPVSRGYIKVMPATVVTHISNFLSNLGYPAVVINQLLQGNFRLGIQDLGRLVVNTTVGIAGIFDVGTGWGLPAHEEDFGQTFGKWGLQPGPYLVVPFWGPSNPRDGFGDIMSGYTYPPSYLDSDALRYSLFGLWAIDRRAQFLEAEKLIKGDRYLFIRDAYLQRREYLVTDGEQEDLFMEEE